MPHFITLADLPADSYTKLILRAIELKQLLKEEKTSPQTLKQKSFIMLFEKPSTRTRISFEIGISQMGGNAIFISGKDSQMSRGEPIRDTARIISSMADGIIIRANSHKDIIEFAANSTVPVINALSSDFHPCQILADLATYYELRGDIKDKKVVWCGDGNNMCKSYIQMASIIGFQLHLAVPEEFLPESSFIEAHKDWVTISPNIKEAMEDASLVCTDVWVSMGDENADTKRKILQDFQVTPQMLDMARSDVLFMHCLPAKEGEEVSQGLLDDARSAVWLQGENRLHSQKALLEFLF